MTIFNNNHNRFDANRTKVPVFDRDSPGSGQPASSVVRPTENVFFEIVKVVVMGSKVVVIDG